MHVRMVPVRPAANTEYALMHDDNIETLCNTADGVFVVDADKHIIRWNKGAERILKLAEPDVLNRDCHQVISGRTLQEKPWCGQNCKMHSAVLKGAPQKNFDLLTRDREGEPLWLNITVVSPLNLESPFVAHIFRDVTREKKTALAVERFLASLEGRANPAEDLSGQKQRQLAARSPGNSRVVLSTREIEVLTLLAEGLSTKALAQKLEISHFTARNHIQNILVKLNLHSKAQAVSYAFKKGIL